MTVVDRLLDSWEQFDIPLRLGAGFDEDAHTRFTDALRACAVVWKGADCIPRRAVNVLVDVFAAIEANAGLPYEPAEQRRIREAAYRFQELIGDAVY